MSKRFLVLALVVLTLVALSGVLCFSTAEYKLSFATSNNNIYQAKDFNPLVDFTVAGDPNSLVGTTYGNFMPGYSMTHTIDISNRNTEVPYTVSLFMNAVDGTYGHDSTFLFRNDSPILVTAVMCDASGNEIAGSKQSDLKFVNGQLNFTLNNQVFSGGANAVYKLKVTFNWPLNAGAAMTSFTRYNGTETLSPELSAQLGISTQDLVNGAVCNFSYTHDDLFENNDARITYAVTLTQA